MATTRLTYTIGHNVMATYIHWYSPSRVVNLLKYNNEVFACSVYYLCNDILKRCKWQNIRRIYSMLLLLLLLLLFFLLFLFLKVSFLFFLVLYRPLGIFFLHFTLLLAALFCMIMDTCTYVCVGCAFYAAFELMTNTTLWLYHYCHYFSLFASLLLFIFVFFLYIYIFFFFWNAKRHAVCDFGWRTL